MWLHLTQGDGKEIRINMTMAAAYYTDKPPAKDVNLKGCVTVIDSGNSDSAYWVTETVERIDALLSGTAVVEPFKSEPKPTAGGWDAKTKPSGGGWGDGGNKT